MPLNQRNEIKEKMTNKIKESAEVRETVHTLEMPITHSPAETYVLNCSQQLKVSMTSVLNI